MALGGPWGATATMAISPSPSLLFPSTLLADNSNLEHGTLVTDHILPDFTSSSSWRRNEKTDYSTGNKSTSMTNVLDTVGLTLQLFLNGTRQFQDDQGMYAFSTASTTVTSEDSIADLSFATSSEDDFINNGSIPSTTPSTAANNQQASFPGKNVIIPLYTLIFFLSIFGNLMVILTLARNRRMRTVTNVLLLNLVRSQLVIPCLLIYFSYVNKNSELLLLQSIQKPCTIFQKIFSSLKLDYVDSN